MPNLELQRKRDLSTFRRVALGTWRTAYDCSVYGTMEMRMDRASRAIPRLAQFADRVQPAPARVHSQKRRVGDAGVGALRRQRAVVAAAP